MENERSVDNIDLRSFDLSTTRAILLADSELADHCIGLGVNKAHVVPITFADAPLPLNNRLAEGNVKADDDSATGQITLHNNNKSTHSNHNRYSRAFVLSQTREKETFSLGAAPDNDIIFTHPLRDIVDDYSDLCYINYQHIKIYPDPDGNGLELHNTSASVFVYYRLSCPDADHQISRGEERRLACGSWRLTLGKGLSFQIRVLPDPTGAIPLPGTPMCQPNKAFRASVNPKVTPLLSE
jgi:hypothetical protein